MIGEFGHKTAIKKDQNQIEMILKDSIKAQNIENLKKNNELLHVSPIHDDGQLVISKPMVSTMTTPQDNNIL